MVQISQSENRNSYKVWKLNNKSVYRSNWAEGNPKMVDWHSGMLEILLFASRQETWVSCGGMDHFGRHRLYLYLIECFHMTSQQPYCSTKQWNGGHVGVLNQSFRSWTLFLWKHFLLIQWMCMTAGHVSEIECMALSYFFKLRFKAPFTLRWRNLRTNSSGLKSVFEKLRFRDRLAWTIGLTVEIKMRSNFSGAV